MNFISPRLIKSIAKLLFASIILFFCLFQIELDPEPRHVIKLENTQTFINKIDWDRKNSNIEKCGFSKQNISPDEPVRLAGYGFRKEFKGVHDSLFVRSIVFTYGEEITALISLDLMLVTPNLTKEIELRLHNIGVDNIYLSASHSHSSFGGYGENIIGKLILGGKNQNIINKIVSKTVLSVKESMKNAQNINKIQYGKAEFRGVKNRLNDERNVPENFRNIFIEQESGKRINIMSFNAHPTIIAHDETLLSNDYPGVLCDLNKNDFSVFIAGTMGSITPIIYKGNTQFNKANEYAKLMLDLKLDMLDSLGTENSYFKKIKLQKPNLSLYLNQNIKLRTWLFNLIFGETESYINVLKIGQVLMIGLPVELSSEYYEELSRQANSKGLKLIITSFNGTYLGYATPSKYFIISHRETREMNWTGKFGGDYFNGVIKMIIEKQ